ncbi:MAG: radical SAM protein, partial [Elusimicrobiales bacterium]|nr:radical SAM protein [Elusimicrobiales bacterium]
RRLRARSPESILREVRLLKETYKITELLVWDDTFTIDRERAKKIARGIKSAAGVPWSCYSRVDDADEGLYSELAAAGCTELLFGAESGDNAILASIRKGITREQTERAVKLCREKGLSSFCSVILGLPGDTRQTMKETVDFFTRLNPDYAAFCVLIPFPGTELFRDAVAKGLIDLKNADWKAYVKIFSSALPPVSLCQVSREELVKIQKSAFRRFFLRPGYVYGRLAKAVHTGFGRRLVSFYKGAAALARHQLHRFE